MNSGTVHIVGAGLAGLAAAVALTEKGVRVEILEAAPQAGGRCRSYFEPALGRVIDNGNHLVLSGNMGVNRYLRTIGAENALRGPESAEFAFADIGGDSDAVTRWTIHPNAGATPWWILSRARRVPGTKARDYLALKRLAGEARNVPLGAIFPSKGALWERLLHPVLLAALNTAPETGSAKLASAVLRETMIKGGRFYQPRIAHPTLAAAFVDPAAAYLNARGIALQLGCRVTGLAYGETRITGLALPKMQVNVGERDSVILAVPPWTASSLLPGLTAPDEFRAIVNGHFAFAPPTGVPSIMGVLGGTAEWIFALPDRISVTVSNADHLVDRDREELAALLWRDIQKTYGIRDALPPWQIVKEKRATFAATPEQEAKRPAAATRWPNLFLAGDWVDTGLPATIEGAIRSGHRAAQLALRQGLG